MANLSSNKSYRAVDTHIVYRPNILVLDDEECIRRLFSRLLERRGYSCSLASNGDEARDLLNTNFYQLLICDLNLSGESGADFVQYVADHHPETAIITVTGGDSFGAITEAALNKMTNGHIKKPFEPVQFFSTIDVVLCDAA